MCLGTISVGLKKKPNRGGLDPRWVIELKIAKLLIPSSETEPIRLAD